MADKFPKPYIDSAKQDDATVVYVNGGAFNKMGIGAGASGLPKGDAAPSKSGMGLDHVGDTAGGKK
jgi:hypothetical protein